MANQDRVPFSHAFERDLRLDLFRGMGLWMIFLDHIPHDIVAWLTLRNYGFSDAAEFFVFISGYLAGYIYGPIIRAGNFLAAVKRLWTRVWQMYVAHIMLFLLFTAQIARTVRKWDNPMYEDEFNVHNFLQHPDVLIGQALTLRYKPVDLDVLPLYISLIAASPLILWCLRCRPASVPDPVSPGAGIGRCVDALCPPDRHDLARPVAGIIGAEMDDQGDLS